MRRTAEHGACRGSRRRRGGAHEALLPLVYGELEVIAQGYLARRAASLEPRDLVHELSMRIARAASALIDG